MTVPVCTLDFTVCALRLTARAASEPHVLVAIRPTARCIPALAFAHALASRAFNAPIIPSCASHRYILLYPGRLTKATTKCHTPADAIIMDDVEKLAKARKKQASLFATKPLRSPASAQVRGHWAGPQRICML